MQSGVQKSRTFESPAKVDSVSALDRHLTKFNGLKMTFIGSRIPLAAVLALLVALLVGMAEGELILKLVTSGGSTSCSCDSTNECNVGSSDLTITAGQVANGTCMAKIASDATNTFSGTLGDWTIDATVSSFDLNLNGRVIQKMPAKLTVHSRTRLFGGKIGGTIGGASTTFTASNPSSNITLDSVSIESMCIILENLIPPPVPWFEIRGSSFDSIGECDPAFIMTQGAFPVLLSVVNSRFSVIGALTSFFYSTSPYGMQLSMQNITGSYQASMGDFIASTASNANISLVDIEANFTLSGGSMISASSASVTMTNISGSLTSLFSIISADGLSSYVSMTNIGIGVGGVGGGGELKSTGGSIIATGGSVTMTNVYGSWTSSTSLISANGESSSVTMTNITGSLTSSASLISATGLSSSVSMTNIGGGELKSTVGSIVATGGSVTMTNIFGSLTSSSSLIYASGLSSSVTLRDIYGTFSSTAYIFEFFRDPTANPTVSLTQSNASFIAGGAIFRVSNVHIAMDSVGGYFSAPTIVQNSQIVVMSLVDLFADFHCQGSSIQANHLSLTVDNLSARFFSPSSVFINAFLSAVVEVRHTNFALPLLPTFLKSPDAKLSFFNSSISFSGSTLISSTGLSHAFLENTHLGLEENVTSIFVGSAPRHSLSLSNASILSEKFVPMSLEPNPTNLTLADSQISGIILPQALTTSHGISTISNSNSTFTSDYPLIVVDGEITIITTNDNTVTFANSSVFIGNNATLFLPPISDGYASSIIFEGDIVVDSIDSAPCNMKVPKIDFLPICDSFVSHCHLIVTQGISSLHQVHVSGSGDFSELSVSGSATYDAFFNMTSFKTLTVYPAKKAESETAIRGSTTDSFGSIGLPGMVRMLWPNNGTSPKFPPSYYPLFEVDDDVDPKEVKKLSRSEYNDKFWYDSELKVVNRARREENEEEAISNFVSLTRRRCPPDYNIANSKGDSYTLCCMGMVCMVPTSVTTEKMILPTAINVSVLGNLSVHSVVLNDSLTSIIVSGCVSQGFKNILLNLSQELWDKLVKEVGTRNATLLMVLNERCPNAVNFKDIKIQIYHPKTSCRTLYARIKGSSRTKMTIVFHLSHLNCFLWYGPAALVILCLAVIAIICLVKRNKQCRRACTPYRDAADIRRENEAQNMAAANAATNANVIALAALDEERERALQEQYPQEQEQELQDMSNGHDKGDEVGRDSDHA